MGAKLNIVRKWEDGTVNAYATLKCLRKTFLNDDNLNIVARLNPPKSLVEACNSAWVNKEDKAICIRSGMAGASVAALFASLRGEAESKFETPDMRITSKTDDNHPTTQCRLDTYFQGALCEASSNEDVSQKDEVEGTCHQRLGHKNGLRPLCWLKSKI
jgi:hypothetical protein